MARLVPDESGRFRFPSEAGWSSIQAGGSCLSELTDGNVPEV